MNQNSPISAPNIDFNAPSAVLHRRLRSIKDKAASAGVGIGGISVIIAILLIFFYLLYEVVPMFRAAHIEQQAVYDVPGQQRLGKTLYLATEEQAEVAMRLTDQGQVVFFDTRSGQIVAQHALPVPATARVTTVAADSPSSQLLAVGLDNGQALVVKHRYRVTYPDDRRLITPLLEYPYGETPLTVDAQGRALQQLTVRDTENSLVLGGATPDNQLVMRAYDKEEDFLTMEITLNEEPIELPRLDQPVQSMLLGPDQRWLYVASQQGQIDVYDLSDRDHVVLNERISVTADNSRIGSMAFLLGGISVLLGDEHGGVSQWFLVRNEHNKWAFKEIRRFEHAATPIVAIAPEHRRKGFVVADANGVISIYNSTAHRTLLQQPLVEGGLQGLAISPRADLLLVEESSGRIKTFEIDNEHPEVSWSVLWEKVWYESYEEPAYIWQSSASTNDFEPKFSLMPLAFGTLKAAFYAMLMAAPLAICGAIYTAYFMAPAMRRKVKPIIELMEALPTVILGFLAGLFLAPYVEKHLPGIFSLLILLPVGMLLFGFVWAQLPNRIRLAVPDGWQAALMIPVVLLVGWFALGMSQPLEQWFFNGDMRSWLTHDLGITYDQRNALVVGLAMGFAVIPTIFSIAEDAIFSVPKHLSYGSLALGATPWQTLVRVVLPTASPGIFSALMIGLGRAVGETMIVLMATGNTPIMDANIFEGMRTLAANIAVEVPESEVGSSHYRILFLAAFVLFMFTFVVNTLAELVRQRLRNKYGSL